MNYNEPVEYACCCKFDKQLPTLEGVAPLHGSVTNKAISATPPMLQVVLRHASHCMTRGERAPSREYLRMYSSAGSVTSPPNKPPPWLCQTSLFSFLTETLAATTTTSAARAHRSRQAAALHRVARAQVQRGGVRGLVLVEGQLDHGLHFLARVCYHLCQSV